MLYYAIGIAAFIYGNANLFASRFGWEKLLRPRDKLRQRHGEERGDMFFTLTYIVLPLIVAAVGIFRGMYPPG